MAPVDLREGEIAEFEPRIVSAKFSYLGVCKKLHFALKATKKEIISMLMNVFNLPTEFKNALLLKHANGTTYDENTLKYQLEYFPRSNNIIFIRIDPTKVKCAEDSPTRDQSSNIIVKVFRQNCFLVASPINISYRKRHKSPSSDSPPIKRRRLLIHSKKPKNHEKAEKIRI